MLVTMLQASVNTLRASGVDILPKIEEKMETLKGLIEHLQERSRKGTLRTDRDTYALLTDGDDNQGEEQEDFRNIPLYPTPEEFQQNHRPFLRPNLTSQRYTNTHLYLDTHFRLLREDFVRPLREGIQQLLQNEMGKGRNDNPMKMKRFDDILSDREPKDLEKGLVQITFTEESRIKLARIQTDQFFLMVETTAYFEAYRYVLEGLKEQTEEDLPFQRYIVECSTDVQPPAYLRRKDVYNLSPVANPEHKNSIRPFSSLDTEAWPDMEELGLDESQMKAFQLALTKELAIIQGPPGTEEAELIQAERMIDDGWTIGPRADRDDKKKGKVDESVREVEELMLAMNLDNIDVRVQQSEDAWQVTTLWVTRYRIELRTKALESEQAYQIAVDRLADVKRQENLHILKKATVHNY
ncbi:hypothetical protein GOODEAATRI_003729 [Goodea atripinnis]|uniref:Uncharacterized protein n=1 Tax=Goodea atripinnis TaxID=208336 RepID=A0ABV0P1E6_9TELE